MLTRSLTCRLLTSTYQPVVIDGMANLTVLRKNWRGRKWNRTAIGARWGGSYESSWGPFEFIDAMNAAGIEPIITTAAESGPVEILLSNRESAPRTLDGVYTPSVFSRGGTLHCYLPCLLTRATLMLSLFHRPTGKAKPPYATCCSPSDMADLVEYCWGDPYSTEWGKVRAADGHPAPYRVRYIELGNEQYNHQYIAQVVAMEERASVSEIREPPPTENLLEDTDGLLHPTPLDHQ